jgi:HSP20 family protein
MLWPSLRPMRRRGTEIAARERETDPFGALFQQVEDMFEDFTRSYGLPAAPATAGVLAPRIDVSESDSEIEIKADLPGVEEKDVEVTLSGDVLTIKGEKKQEREEKKKDYHLVERSYGSFQRTLRVPFEVDPAKVKASFDKGVLTVSLPKPPQVKEQVKKIAVQSKR